MTIQEQYNSYLKGSISREKLLYNIRRSEILKPFVTNLTSFTDAIKILKNRGIISEIIKKNENLTIDMVNPYEYKLGLDTEADLCYKQVPNFLNMDEVKELQKKVLKNLGNDPNYYTKLKAGVKPDSSPDLVSNAQHGEKGSKRNDVHQPLEIKNNKGNFKDEKNARKLVKNDKLTATTIKANVKGMLDSNIKKRMDDQLNPKIQPLQKTKVPTHSSNKPSIDSGNENKTQKNPKKIKIMSMTPKKIKGVKTMKMPGKEKIININESKKTNISLLSLLENIPLNTSEYLPFANVKPGMKAFDDTGKNYKVIATGNYNQLRKYDTMRSMDKFISTDPSGIDSNQLVALMDDNNNTIVRVYGTGGVYVKDVTTFESSIKVKPNSPEADPNNVKKYTDKGFDIELDPSLKEDKNFEPEIMNKSVPQDEEAKAEAKAAILVALTKAMLNKNVNLDKDVAIRGGYIWVRVPLGYGSLSKEQLKALCGESKFQGLNPISDTELTLIFDKK